MAVAAANQPCRRLRRRGWWSWLPLLTVILPFLLFLFLAATGAQAAAEKRRGQQEEQWLDAGVSPQARGGRKGLLLHHRYRATAASDLAAGAAAPDMAVSPEMGIGEDRIFAARKRHAQQRRTQRRRKRRRRRRQQEEEEGGKAAVVEAAEALPPPQDESTPAAADPTAVNATTQALLAATDATSQQQPLQPPPATTGAGDEVVKDGDVMEPSSHEFEDEKDEGGEKDGRGTVPPDQYPVLPGDSSWRPTFGTEEAAAQDEGGQQEHAHGSRAFFGGGPFAFFVAGVALLAVAAYHVSRRQLAATATHAALQSEYSPSSPRITYDRAAAAAASVAAQHQQQQKDRATPPRLHLEPTYTKHAASAKGRARNASGVGTGLTSSASPRSAPGALSLPPFRLNHHKLAKGTNVVVPPAASSLPPTHAAPRNMSIYREAPCSACGISPRTHALVPCSHLVCEDCATTASFCPTCASAVVAKNWVISP